MKSIIKLIVVIALPAAALAAGYWWGSANQSIPAPNGMPEAGTKAHAASTGKKGKILYYRNPMGHPDTSPGAQERFDGHGLSPGLRGRRVAI